MQHVGVRVVPSVCMPPKWLTQATQEVCAKLLWPHSHRFLTMHRFNRTSKDAGVCLWLSPNYQPVVLKLQQHGGPKWDPQSLFHIEFAKNMARSLTLGDCAMRWPSEAFYHHRTRKIGSPVVLRLAWLVLKNHCELYDSLGYFCFPLCNQPTAVQVF